MSKSNELYEARANLIQQLAVVEVRIAREYVENDDQNEAGLDAYAVTELNKDVVHEELEDAISHLLNCPLRLFLEALDAAGYTAHNIEDAVDAGDHWVFVYKDVEGGYSVGRYRKSTATKGGDYMGEPLEECVEKEVAIAIARAVAKAAR